MEELNEATYEKTVAKGVNVVDFWAPWCGPCKLMGPVFEKVSKEIKGAKFAKVNVDENQELSGNANVMSIPTLLIVKNGKEVDRHTGSMGEHEFKSWVEQHV